MTENIFDHLFHRCALTAYLDQAAEQQGWPDSEATKQRAYHLYEVALAEKNRRCLEQRVSADCRPITEDVTP
jgi:hypothetical protein